MTTKAAKKKRMTLERGILFLDDGAEVSGISVDMIKAAPDLLHMLEYMFEFAYDQADPHYTQDEVMSVIRKAKGETE